MQSMEVEIGHVGAAPIHARLRGVSRHCIHVIDAKNAAGAAVQYGSNLATSEGERSETRPGIIHSTQSHRREGVRYGRQERSQCGRLRGARLSCRAGRDRSCNQAHEYRQSVRASYRTTASSHHRSRGSPAQQAAGPSGMIVSNLLAELPPRRPTLPADRFSW